MWHYTLPESEISKEEAMKIVQELPAEDGNFVGFCNELGERIQNIRDGQDDYLLDIPLPDSEYVKQAYFLDREKMLKVIERFLNNEEWMSLCEWKVYKPLRFSI